MSMSTPSKCTAKAIRAYFQNGTLPAPDTLCDPDFVPFDQWNSTTISASKEYLNDDQELEAALLKLMVGPAPKSPIMSRGLGFLPI
jgi:hypothetical protein